MISVTKIFLNFLFFVFWTTILVAQNSFEEQFDHAKKLYEEEKYFDAVTEFKRLLYFDLSGTYSYQANFLIGLSYKNGNKFSDALQYFTLSDLSSTTSDEAFESQTGNN